MTERKTFQTHLRQAATSILERVPEQLKREIYVLARCSTTVTHAR
ncbi:hypothetical protein ACIQVC_36080 [Streptomyces sp. NPDC101112]|nr:hypothetical protein [Streptomyces sp. JV178]